MRPFRFRLETVRRLRDHAEQRARDELARELSTHASLVDEHERSCGAVSAAAAGARDADLRARVSWQHFIERRERERSAAAHELRAQADRVDEQRGVLGQANREHRAILRLEEKHRARHQGELLRRQDAELSDIAIQAHRRAEAGAA